jgi:hypothetical protein
MTLEGTNKRVGIGTTSPDRLLEITEQGTGAAYLRLSSTNTSYPSDTIFGGIEFYNADSSGAGVGATIDALSNGSGRGGYLQFRTDPDGSGSPSVRMTIDENGNVGIGTTSPGGELHVAGSIIVDYAIAHGGDTNNQIVFTTDTQSFNTDGTTRMTIASDGAVSVAGAFSAATKSFDIEHPTKEGMRLHHGSLEGPEHGVYIRGRLEGNEIDLPDYWLGLVDEDTITVQLTPNRGFQQIYVQDISDNKVHVASHDGKPIDCFYLIQGERKDIERFEVEY